jgi:hypothetical protein
MVTKWIIVYDDTSMVSSDASSPDRAPIDGVQWIVEFMDNGGTRNVHGMDYYKWTGDSWAGGNMNDLERWLRRRNEIPIILYGRWISDSEYQKIREIVQELKYDS